MPSEPNIPEFMDQLAKNVRTHIDAFNDHDADALAGSLHYLAGFAAAGQALFATSWTLQSTAYGPTYRAPSKVVDNVADHGTVDKPDPDIHAAGAPDVMDLMHEAGRQAEGDNPDDV